MDDVNEWRDSVRKLEQSVKAKMQRIYRKQDINLARTEFDPRRDPEMADKYNVRQLKAYAEQLEDFVNRRNQYVAGYDNKPIPRNEWRDYKRQEQMYNDRVNSDFEKVMNLPLDADTSIGQSMAARHGLPGQQRINDPSVNAPYNPAVRSPESITSRKALERMRDKYIDMNKATIGEKRLREAREQAEEMAETIGKPEILEALEKLSDKQFLTLWNFSGVATALSIMYHFSQKLLDRELKAYENKFSDDSLNDFNRLVEAASQWDDESY